MLIVQNQRFEKQHVIGNWSKELYDTNLRRRYRKHRYQVYGR